MTEQVPDTCTIDGRMWSIDSWNGPFDCIPENDALGFQTISRSTANWGGRIDHFLIFKEQLYLFKVEVELRDKDKNLVPFGARREIRQIYEPLEVNDKNGMHFEERLHESHYFIFDDLKIDFSGTIELSYPIWDPWDYPWPLDEEDIEPTEECIVEFSNGKVVSIESWDV